MALVLKDRVLENSLSTGTGSFTLAGPQVGYQSFSVIGNGNTTYYTIQGKYSNGNLNGEWEVGVGTWSTGNILSRDTVLESSNSNNLVVFSTGDKDVFCDLPAEKISPTDVLGTMAYQNANAVNITGGMVDVDAGTAALPTLGTTGDPNTGIFFPAADTVAIATNGAERMRINSSGNVGIGVTPSYRLDVAGASRVYSASGASPISYWWSGSGYRLAINMTDGASGLAIYNTLDGNAHTWQTASTERMRIDSAGNLGLGVTPSAWGTTDSIRALQLSGGAFYVYGANRTFQGQNVYLASGGIETYVATAVASTYRQFNGIHSWLNAPSGTANTGITFSERMTLNAGGNLGIGITAPINKLHVYDANVSISMNEVAAGGTGVASSRWKFSTNHYGIYVGSVNAMVFYDYGASAERMRIHSSGGVSIGNTTDPGAANLSVTGSANIQTLTVGLGGGAVSSNTAVGAGVLAGAVTGARNTAVGQNSLAATTSGYSLSAYGWSVLSSNTTGHNSVGVGNESLFFNLTGAFNTAIGAGNQGSVGGALWRNVSGSNNTAIGNQSLLNNTTASNLTAVGYQSLLNNTTNVATLGTITGGTGYTNGTYTGVAMTLSSGSTAVTYPTATIVVAGGVVTTVTITSAGVGFKDTTTVLTAPAASIGGTGSGFSVPVATLASGNSNLAVGYQALFGNTIGAGNIALGFQAATSNTIGNGNSALGVTSLALNTTGSQNTAVGYNALFSNSSGTSNTSFGYQAGYGNASANANTTGSNNTYLGYRTVGSGIANTNEMVIGYNAVGNGSNTTTIGNTSTTLTRVFGVIQSTTYTVASLPSATTSGVGARAFVTDALAPTFGATVMTGGAVATPVYSDGTNWKVG